MKIVRNSTEEAAREAAMAPETGQTVNGAQVCEDANGELYYLGSRQNLLDMCMSSLKPRGADEMWQTNRNDHRKLTEVGPEAAMQMPGFRPKSVWDDGWRYVLPSLASKLFHLKTPWEAVDNIEWWFKYYLSLVDSPEQLEQDLAGLERTWPRMKEMLRNNRGMAKLMDEHGFASRYIYSYILGGASAISLEVFHGRAYDIAGNFTELSMSDMAAYYAVWEPIGVFLRERLMYAQKFLNKQFLRVLSCGAGFCPEHRLNGFPARQLHHEVLAVDADPRVHEQARMVFGCDPSELGINYRLNTVEYICDSETYAEYFDVVLAQGLLSYYHDFGNNQRTVALLKRLKRVLKPGGIVICDLQVMEPTLLRCALSMGWESKLTPDLTAKMAIRRLIKACREAGLQVMEARIDSRNPRPCGVIFRLRKPN